MADNGIPQDLPVWARELALKYLARTTSQFVLVGNVRDLYPMKTAEGISYVPLRDFLSKALFGTRDAVLLYDRSSGIGFADNAAQKDFSNLAKAVDTVSGASHSKTLPRDPLGSLALIERYIKTRIAEGKRLAVILDYAETIAPAGSGGYLSENDRSVLVTLRRWAADPQMLAADLTVVLVAQNPVELHPHILQNPYSTMIRIALPSIDERRAFIDGGLNDKDAAKLLSVTPEALAALTAGLSLVQIAGLIAEAEASDRPLGVDQLLERKKELIERDCFGLLEFVTSAFDLSMVAGHQAMKNELASATRLLKSGRLSSIPMGYLICGPVGTGKSFLTACFACEIGAPMVRLLNIRSQWQGVTEANVQKILDLLRELGPVAVMMDEADAFLGDRESSGDSGTSSRVFSQIASFMADTSLRGRVIWFLITARPDRLPVDIKRQGRAEEHLALFHPETDDDLAETFQVVCRKNGVTPPRNALESIKRSMGEGPISGADLESVAVRAKRIAAVNDRDKPSPEDFEKAFAQFVAPSYSDQIRYQTLIAAIECTNRDLLPSSLAKLSRSELMEQAAVLKERISRI